MLPRMTSDPGLCAETVTRIRTRHIRKHTSYSEQLNTGKSSTFRQMEKMLIQMSKVLKMSPRGQHGAPDTVECKRIHLCIHVPKKDTGRLETLRCFRQKYASVRIYSWNLRVINEFRGDGQCWVVVLYIEDTDKK